MAWIQAHFRETAVFPDIQAGVRARPDAAVFVGEQGIDLCRPVGGIVNLDLKEPIAIEPEQTILGAGPQIPETILGQRVHRKIFQPLGLAVVTQG